MAQITDQALLAKLETPALKPVTDEALLAKLNGQEPQGIPNWSVPTDAIYRAGAGTLDMFGNAPTNLANLGIAGYGAARTALGGDPNKAPKVLPTPDLAQRGAEKLGLIQPESRLTPKQQYAESAIGGATLGLLAPEARLMNAVSGAVAGPASKATAERLGPAAGAVAAMAAPSTLRTMGNAAHIGQTVRQAAARTAVENGFVVPPTEMASNPVSRSGWAAVQSLGGKAAIGQDFSSRNQQNINNLARRELGLNGQGQISDEEVNKALQPHLQVYEQATAIHPAIAQAVREWRSENDLVRRYSKEYARTHTVESEDNMSAARQRADSWLNWIDQAAASTGRPDMQQAMSQARISLGRIGTLERALGTGDVSARLLARDPARRFYPDGGGFDTISKFYDDFPKMAQPAAQTQQHGVHGLLPWLAGTAGLAGEAAGLHGTGMLPLAALALPPATRAALASAPVQRMASSKDYLAQALRNLNAGVPLIQEAQQ